MSLDDLTMVIGLIGAVAAVPAIVGTTEAVRQGQRQNAREEHRARRSEMVASVLSGTKSKRREELDGGLVVLWKNRLWIRTNSGNASRLDTAHPFSGYFLQHPDQPKWRDAGHSPRGEGLVSTISDDPPYLNWIYVDGSTHALSYGTKAEVLAHEGVPGPWDVTTGVGTDKGTGLLGGGRRMTFEGWEGFVAVEEEVDTADSDNDDDDKNDDEDDDNDGEDDDSAAGDADKGATEMMWAIYVDVDDDGLRSGGRIGSEPGKHSMLEIQLTRREKRQTRASAIEDRKERLRARKEHEEKQQARREETDQPIGSSSRDG